MQRRHRSHTIQCSLSSLKVLKNIRKKGNNKIKRQGFSWFTCILASSHVDPTPSPKTRPSISTWNTVKTESRHWWPWRTCYNLHGCANLSMQFISVESHVRLKWTLRLKRHLPALRCTLKLCIKDETTEQATVIQIKEIRTSSLSAVMEPVCLMEPSNLGSVGLEGTGIAVSSLGNGCLSSAFAFPIFILPLAKGLTSLWLEPGSPFARDKYISAESLMLIDINPFSY